MNPSGLENPLNPSNTIRAVLCYIEREEDEKFLLLHKAKGKFGEGFWNAPGGKIEPKESPKSAAQREVFEETGLTVFELEGAGKLEFYFGPSKKKPDWIAEVFKTSKFVGRAKARGEEGTLRWFPKDNLPFERMWEDDRYWLPLLVKGIRFSGKFEFTADSKTLVSHKITKL